jgi:YD repeat-containing protein
LKKSPILSATAADGTQIPELKSWSTTEYDIEGRIMATRARDSDGSEWVTRNTYDASGHLLKTAWGKEGEPIKETVYSYDDQGRLLNTTYSDAPDNPVTFRYDERGRKTKLQVSRPEDYLPNAAFSGSPFQIADTPPNLPGGGSATTIYDEHDRPAEVQVRDAQGELVSRAVCIYDAQGRVAEEKEILDNPEMLFPAEVRAKMLEESGASREELREALREQFTKLMGGQAEPFSIAYSYDAQGRVRQTRRRIYNQEDMIETTYTKHGDTAAEITRSTRLSSANEQSLPTAGVSTYSEVRHSYEYDDRGNWTEEIVSYRSSPDGAFSNPSSERRRTLTYY